MKLTNGKTKGLVTPYDFILGPVKVKDGLFMGDQLAAKDINFIIGNKVTYIINTVSKEIPNLWQRFGIQYLSVSWTERQLKIFDKKNNGVNAIYNFIEEAIQKGQSCLVHSINGKSRASAVMIAYLIKKYNWSLKKCVEFLTSKKKQLTIRPIFMMQLEELESRMSQIYKLSSLWNQYKNQQELILANTFINTHIPPQKSTKIGKKTKKRVTFISDRSENRLINNNSLKKQKNTQNFKPKPIIKEAIQKEQLSDQQTTFSQLSPLLKRLKQKTQPVSSNKNLALASFNNFIKQDLQIEENRKKQTNQRDSKTHYSNSKQKIQNQLQKKAMPQSDHYRQVAKLLKSYDSKGQKPLLHKKNQKQKNKRSLLTSYQKQEDESFSREPEQKSFGFFNGQDIQKFTKKRYPSASSKRQFVR